MLMKILHVTSDNKPGGIQKAFKNYVAALAPLSEFENFYFTPIIYIQTRVAISESYKIVMA
ncbi:MAG: hypothetical protein CM15mP117_24360 [Alphaproteobacteria bacterium]|nr:MAG: hypothetical protein CM15mP117_24360 [Alphaproteobacteria bacterium]